MGVEEDAADDEVRPKKRPLDTSNAASGFKGYEHMSQRRKDNIGVLLG